ncbi:hypothetical protein G4G28_20485 [Massilia sp. Dwa41.01b]|uniref:hypothetical protein n=1 Tax=unclassified Massilia TaxID=2609279 RepID=UPI0016002755|nr:MULTISPECIES: hypothetical protein [unclassified Massilia]QNA90283.1 hypothetical protein G4G28_20485 [Massilia sp. Dwa41.01b]QNB01184.1 hypothetical protein G4G31_24115 [Massilia sp. Se16.2.3]
MSRQTLRDARYRTIGYIDTAPDGRQTGSDARFRTVGYYDPRTNLTRDERFRTVGSGNMLASLIVCA